MMIVRACEARNDEISRTCHADDGPRNAWVVRSVDVTPLGDDRERRGAFGKNALDAQGLFAATAFLTVPRPRDRP